MPRSRRDALGLPPVDLPHPVLCGTRLEHLRACKERALEYLPGDPGQALASMASDLGKHEDFRGPIYEAFLQMGMMEVVHGSDAIRRWIEGFN